MMKKLLIAVALTTVLGAVQARSTVALIEPSRVVLASSGDVLNTDKVKSAIVRAGARRQWAVHADAPGKLVMKYNKQNKHEVVVEIAYDTSGYQIRYVSSTNMKYETEAGVPMIHPFYNKWVTTLSQDIVTEVSLAP